MFVYGLGISGVHENVYWPVFYAIILFTLFVPTCSLW